MKTSKKTIGSILLALAIICTGAASHATVYVSGAGTACEPQIPATDSIRHTIAGADNPSTSAASNLVCPLALGTQSSTYQSINHVYLLYKDFSSTDNFLCLVYQGFDNGSVAMGSSKYTCSTSGGCNDPTQSYTGSGTLHWTGSSELNVNNLTINVTGNFGVYCSVPKSSGTNSFIVTYYATS